MSNDFLHLDSHSRRSFVERCARAAFGISILPFLEGARSLGLKARPTLPRQRRQPAARASARRSTSSFSSSQVG